MSEINTSSFEDRSTDSDSDSDSDQDKKEQNTDTTSPFNDPAMDLDIIDPDPEEQQQIKTTPYKTSAHNPFDDPLGDNYNNRDRYDGADIEDDSVQSMLEMMETKDDPGNNVPGNKYLVNTKNNKSLRSKARGSLPNFRWGSPPSLLGGMSGDDKSLASYDCIALSSLKKVLRNEDTATVDSSVVENNDDNDEESMRSKPTRVRSGDDDAKSDGTTSTKNTVNGPNDNLQQTTPSQSKFLGRRRMKYMILLASFLAIMLLLGILVLSYSLYALRNEED